MNKDSKRFRLDNLWMEEFGEKPMPSQNLASPKNKIPYLAEEIPLRILVVEDRVEHRELALKILQRMGYKADAAGNGREFIQAVRQRQYDVVFTDVQMPEMDGLEATRRISQEWSKDQRPRIIALTANAMPGDREKFLEAGMDDYISKPIIVEELVQVLKRCQGCSARD